MSSDGRPGMDVWRIGACRIAWKAAQRKGHRFDMITCDPGRKAMLMQHELDCKSTLPESMQCMIEKEALAILQPTLQDYKSKLGSKHALTAEVQERISTLRDRRSGGAEEPGLQAETSTDR